MIILGRGVPRVRQRLQVLKAAGPIDVSERLSSRIDGRPTHPPAYSLRKEEDTK